MRKIVLVVACGAALAGCGGGGGSGGYKDPNSVAFTYSDPVAASSSEISSAGSATSSLQTAAALQTADSFDDPSAVNVAFLPTSLAGSLLDIGLPGPSASAGAIAAARALSVPQRAAAFARSDLASATAGFDQPCVTVTEVQVTFANCTVSESGTTSSMTVTLDGVLNRAAGHVDWDVSVSMHAVETDPSYPVDMRMSERLTGDVTVTGATIVGFEQVDAGVSGNIDGQAVNAKVTFRVDVDLGYLSSPGFCVTGGSITGKVVWTQRPSGASASDLPDKAVKLIWVENGGACSSALQVSWGTTN